jgi:hypothetical protein
VQIVLKYLRKALRFKEGQELLSDIQALRETTREIDNLIERGAKLIPQQLQSIAEHLKWAFEGFVGRFETFHRRIERKLARRIMASIVRGRNSPISDFRVQFQPHRNMLSLALHTIILYAPHPQWLCNDYDLATNRGSRLVAREPRIGSTASLPYNSEDIGTIRQWVRADLCQAQQYSNDRFRRRHVARDYRAELIDFAREALRGGSILDSAQERSQHTIRAGRPSHSRIRNYSPNLGRSNSPDSCSGRDQSPPNNRSRYRTNLSPNRFHSRHNKGYYVCSPKRPIPPGRSRDSSSRRTDSSYPTRILDDELLRVIEDPESRRRSYQSYNNHKGSQKPLFEDQADTYVRNASEQHVQLHEVGSAATLPFDRGRSYFRPPSSVEVPSNFQDTDRDHSILIPEPPHRKQARVNSNSHRLHAHEARQNQKTCDRNRAEPSSSSSTDTDAVEIHRTRTHRSGSTINQGVDSGSTSSSTISRRIESNRSASKNRQNSPGYGVERRPVPATTSPQTAMGSHSREYPATPSSRSRSRARSTQSSEIDAHRAPVEQPREHVIATKPRASRAGSVARSFDSGYDEPRPPHRTANVIASKPPIAFYNARGRRSRSSSRSRQEGNKNRRSSSASRDSGIGLDEDLIRQHAFPTNSYIGVRYIHV